MLKDKYKADERRNFSAWYVINLWNLLRQDIIEVKSLNGINKELYIYMDNENLDMIKIYWNVNLRTFGQKLTAKR